MSGSILRPVSSVAITWSIGGAAVDSKNHTAYSARAGQVGCRDGVPSVEVKRVAAWLSLRVQSLQWEDPQIPY